MVKITNKDYVLGDNEYIVSAYDKTSRDYEIYYKGELLEDVTCLVRRANP